MTDEAIFALIPHLSARLVDRMIDGPWPDRGARHLAWTPREITTHLATIVDYFDAMIDGGSPVPGLPALGAANEEGLAERARAPWSEVVDEVRDGAIRVATALEDRGADEALRWHGGIEISPYAAAGAFAGELLIHEWDLTRTLRQRPNLTRGDARIVLAAVRDLIPHVLDAETAAGHRVHLRIRIRGGDVFDIRVADGAMTVASPSGRPDCHVSAAPVTFLLLAYKRRSNIRAAITGGSVAWGRRPWKALSLSRLLDVP